MCLKKRNALTIKLIPTITETENLAQLTQMISQPPSTPTGVAPPSTLPRSEQSHQVSLDQAAVNTSLIVSLLPLSPSQSLLPLLISLSLSLPLFLPQSLSIQYQARGGWGLILFFRHGEGMMSFPSNLVFFFLINVFLNLRNK